VKFLKSIELPPSGPGPYFRQCTCVIPDNLLKTAENRNHDSLGIGIGTALVGLSSVLLSSSGEKEQVWPFFGCCTADSQTDAGRHQLYNNGSLVLFSIAWLLYVWLNKRVHARSTRGLPRAWPCTCVINWFQMGPGGLSCDQLLPSTARCDQLVTPLVTPSLEVCPGRGHVHVHRLHLVGNLVADSVVEPHPAQLGHHVGAQPQRVAPLQAGVSLAVLVHVGRCVEAALGPTPGQQHELALAHAQEDARAGAAPVSVAGARAHRAGAVVDRSLEGVRQSRFGSRFSN